MATFPSDQFDDLPDDLDRVGAHRGPKLKGRGWIAFAWALLATGVLVAAGLFVLQVVDGSVNFIGNTAGPSASATPTTSPTPVITPITDPTTIKSRNITITVLNGTPTAGLQTQAGNKLTAAHWNVTSATLASESNIKKSVVYYSSATNQDVALGVAEALGFKTVMLTDAYPGAPITVVLGADFKG
jgi:LytR cell envelope-related transcriptional attenuator